MEQLIEELNKIIPFKETTETGDIVLIMIEESQVPVYALVTGIQRDVSRKDEWWQVFMQILSVPLQPLVWTLRTEQFTGQEVFTMGGKSRFVQAVHIKQESLEPIPKPVTKQAKGGLRIVK